MVSNDRPEEEPPKRKVWSVLEKLGSAAVVAFVLTLLGIVFGFGGIIRDHDTALDVLTEKRPSGMTPSQQMQYNTLRIDAVLAHIGDIKIEDGKMLTLINENHEAFHVVTRRVERELSTLKERCNRIVRNNP